MRDLDLSGDARPECPLETTISQCQANGSDRSDHCYASTRLIARFYRALDLAEKVYSKHMIMKKRKALHEATDETTPSKCAKASEDTLDNS